MVDNMSVYEKYPTKSSGFLPRPIPSSRISFAADTRFHNRFERRLSDMIQRSTYNIKPVRKEKDGIMRYRAPAATIPVGPYQSVTQRDFKYPSGELLRAMNPQPKWIYRSRSDLGVGRILDHDYQYFNNDKEKYIPGEVLSGGNQSQIDSNIDTENANRAESTFSLIKGQDTLAQSPQFDVGNNTLSTENEDNVYAFYKPLVGDCNDRYIENAQIKRAVEGPVVPTSSFNKPNSHFEKRAFVPRPLRFTDTFNKVLAPQSDTLSKMPARLPGLNRHATTLGIAGGNKGQNAQGRVSLYQQQPGVLSLNRDMTRTYEKQAKLKQMLEK